MNKITINNQEFEETNASIPMTDWTWYQNKWYKPIEQFKVEDWVIFQMPLKQIVRRIISNEEYDSAKNSQILYDKYKEWMTEGAAIELKEQIIRKATSQEILEHLRTIAKEKGLVKGVRIRRINEVDKDAFVPIVQENDNYYIKTDEYVKSGIVLYCNGKWVEKVEKVKDYEILSFQLINSDCIKYKNIYGYFSHGELRYGNSSGDYEITEKALLSNRFFKIHSVKDLKTGNVYTIGDICNPLGKECDNQHPIDRFDIILDGQLRINSKNWYLDLNGIEKSKPKFTFGGYEVSFKVIPNSRERPLKFVEVTCKGETGANYEIFNILENPLKRLPFGKVFTRGFTLKGKLDAQKHIPTIEKGTESSYINEIRIGCLVDKYENLVKIYEHCLTLLKWD